MNKAPLPENLAELMNSVTAPNVTLQRNGIPGQMSNRYQSGLQQQPQPWGQVHDAPVVAILSEHLSLTATVEKHDLQGGDVNS